MGGFFRIALSVALGLAIVGGAFYLRGQAIADKTSDDAAELLIAKKALRTYQDTTDTDGDGMRDWEEELRGTNPNVKDDIADVNSTSSTTDSSPELPDFEPKTLTDRFAIEFFTNFVANRQGEPLAEDEMLSFVEKTADQLVGYDTVSFYTQNDLLIKKDYTVDDIEAYGNRMGQIIQTTGTLKEVEYELILLEKAINTEDPSLLKKFHQIADMYGNSAEEMRHVMVPAGLVREYLGFINALVALRDNMEGLSKLFDDPVVAYVKINRYQSDLANLSNAFHAIRRGLEEASIIYVPSEAGSVFFSITP